MPQVISYDTALEIVLDAVSPHSTEHAPLNNALGRTLAEPLRARTALPPFDNAAMDGYAVRRQDVTAAPTQLHLVGTVSAGSAPERPVEPGTCMQITTGAPLPEGADAVIPVEWTERVDAHTVRFERGPEGKYNVRHRGEDVRADKTVCPAGQVVTPPLAGLASGLGHDTLPVRIPPQVAVLATGDELVRPPRALEPGQIYDVNGPALAGQIESAGGRPRILPIAPDDRAVLRQAIETALDADVLIVAGGLSVGPDDLVRQVLDAMGLDLRFWKVRQRPGKPFAFGHLQETPVFGLPGNPGAAAMCFEAYVRPALARMLGRPADALRATARLDEALQKKQGLHYFTRGCAWTNRDGQLRVREAGAQGSAMYTTVLRANCIVHLPASLRHLQPETPVSIQWLPWAHARSSSRLPTAPSLKEETADDAS